MSKHLDTTMFIDQLEKNHSLFLFVSATIASDVPKSTPFEKCVQMGDYLKVKKKKGGSVIKKCNNTEPGSMNPTDKWKSFVSGC